MYYKTVTLLTCLLLASCGGLRTFHDYARAGDTVAVPVGMQPGFNKDNITVTITPSYGSQIVLDASNPAIRGIINFYPDPISNMIVSREININMSPFATTYANTTLSSAKNDKDYFQTTIFLNLPISLPTGLTQIDVSNSNGASHRATLDIIEGSGLPNTFNADVNGTSINLSHAMLESLSRSAHTIITFDAITLPHAIEINFTHDPDKTVGGSGKAFVVNPLGYRKNLFWQDDGINLKVIMTESQPGLINNIKDFKFYITGTSTNLQLQSIISFDNDGNIIEGITAALTMN